MAQFTVYVELLVEGDSEVDAAREARARIRTEAAVTNRLVVRSVEPVKAGHGYSTVIVLIDEAVPS